MLKEMFMGRAPSEFQINPVVKAFIIAEMMLWSAWNSIAPIFALFATAMAGATIETAGSAFSTYLLVRVMFELISGRLLSGSDDTKKFLFTILGMLILCASYIGFARTTSVVGIYLFYAVAGCGMGIASPAKNSLFSTHLDKNKESLEWGIVDASVFFGMAIAATTGGLIAQHYGFPTLFMIASIVTLVGTLPYVLYIHKDKPGTFSHIFHRHKNTE